jgi:hypothetical protein
MYQATPATIGHRRAFHLWDRSSGPRTTTIMTRPFFTLIITAPLVAAWVWQAPIAPDAAESPDPAVAPVVTDRPSHTL